MDTKLIKQKILDLAIRGKLVPQNPADEPASVLLERIKAEKAQLIKEGKYKKEKDYEPIDNYPFEIPENWIWCRTGEFSYVTSGSTPSKDSFVEEGIPYIKMYNLRNQKIDFYFKPQYIKEDIHNGKLKRSRTEVGDLLMNIVGPPLGKLAIIPDSLPQANFNQAAVLIRPLAHKDIIVKYLFYYLSQMSEIDSVWTKGSAGQVNISLTQSQNLRIALPPLAEQKRIVAEIDRWFKWIDELEQNHQDLHTAIKQAKSKILDLAIHGKLVPQDANDEPASELLRRLDISISNHFSENLPSGWATCTLEDITEYEQPQKYIVSSTEYADFYKTPVLTAGKSFIIGYTNEEDGIFTNLPVIIFDDFTTDSKYVDFPFKVKSSAMKILKVVANIDIKYVTFFMSKTRLIGQTHKRYWISEYCKLLIPIPPYNEQKRIVSKIEELFAKLDKIEESLN